MSDVTRRIGRAGWGSGVGGWLVVLAGTVAAICVHGATDAESGPGTTGGEQPLAQTARESQDGLVWSLAFSPDGSRWASATLTGAVWLSDQTSGQSHLLRRGPALSARTVAFSADGLVLAVAGGGPAVALWDVEAVAELDPLDVGGGEVTHVAFSHDGTRLAVGGRDGRVSLWDWHDRKRIAELAGHRAAVTAMSLSPDGSRLVTGDSTAASGSPSGPTGPGSRPPRRRSRPTAACWPRRARSPARSASGTHPGVSHGAFCPCRSWG